MDTSCSDVISTLSGLLQLKGYQIHNGDASTGVTVDDESGEDWWFTWACAGMSSSESGETFSSCLEAEASAMEHFFASAQIPVDVTDPDSEAQHADAPSLVQDLAGALVGIYPWAKTYIERRRDPLHGPGEFDRIEVARAAVERALGIEETVRRLGQPRGRR
jgi:hypothetical protein